MVQALVVPDTRYARGVDGVHLAYQVSGAGDRNLVLVPGFVSHVELIWDQPFFAGPLLHRLGRFGRVAHFDKRGTGLSDREGGADTPLEDRVGDLIAVMDAAGMERATVIAVSEAGPMCLLAAASHPHRIESLVLVGSFARLVRGGDQSFGYSPSAADEYIALFDEWWGTGNVLGTFFPSLGADPQAVAAMARYERYAASPSVMSAIISLLARIDVREVLPSVTCPTLVIHNTGDPIIPVECGRDLAARIAGARYVEFSSDDHLGSGVGPDLDAIEQFLGVGPVAHDVEDGRERVLATIVFTDIVGSTEQAVRLADAAWRDLLDRHDEVTRELLARFRGREVKATGDGFLAAFDGPARAVQCSLALAAQLRPLGVRIRTGIHTGECEQRGDDLGGVAVHVGARICSMAGPDEVLVSRTVTDLVAGSGLRFTDQGEHDLKGLPGSWRLYRAEP